MQKSWLKEVLRFPLVRLVIRAIAAVLGAFGRLASAAAGALYFPDHASVVCHWSATIKYPERITLGKDIIIGPHCVLGGHGTISLGDHVHLSDGVIIETAGLDFSGPPPFPHVSKPIVIGVGAWLGTKAIVLGGVTIGEGAVIGANAVVSRDVPPFAIYVGAPGSVRDRNTQSAPSSRAGALERAGLQRGDEGS